LSGSAGVVRIDQLVPFQLSASRGRYPLAFSPLPTATQSVADGQDTSVSKEFA
jgi:hypothetical protein